MEEKDISLIAAQIQFNLIKNAELIKLLVTKMNILFQCFFIMFQPKKLILSRFFAN